MWGPVVRTLRSSWDSYDFGNMFAHFLSLVVCFMIVLRLVGEVVVRTVAGARHVVVRTLFQAQLPGVQILGLAPRQEC